MSKNGNREERFIENLALGFNIREAGLKAGYTQSYCNGTLPRKLNSPNFIKKIQQYADSFPEYRQTLAKLRLAKVFHIEEKILDRALQDTDYAITAGVSKTVEREYKLTNLLVDQTVQVTMVPVNVAIQVQNHLQRQESVSSKDDIVTITDGSDKDSK